MNENAYRVRAERGEIQIGTWVTMIRTPAVLTLLKAAGLDFARIADDRAGRDHHQLLVRRRGAAGGLRLDRRRDSPRAPRALGRPELELAQRRVGKRPDELLEVRPAQRELLGNVVRHRERLFFFKQKTAYEMAT